MLSISIALAMGIAMAIDLHFGGSYHGLITVGTVCICMSILKEKKQ